MCDIDKILGKENKENPNILWFLYLTEPEKQQLVMLEIFKLLLLYSHK